MLKEWLTHRIAVKEVESGNIVQGTQQTNSGLSTLSPFYSQGYEDLFAKMNPGDELWKFSSPRGSWACLAGRAGVALVRKGEVVDAVITIMN
jgi:hypothetical protein